MKDADVVDNERMIDVSDESLVAVISFVFVV